MSAVSEQQAGGQDNGNSNSNAEGTLGENDALAENNALAEKLTAVLLEGASIKRVIDLKVFGTAADLVVGAKVDLSPEHTMKEVSVILHQAKRRVRSVVPDAKAVFIEPDVWIDPNIEHPTTSAVVTLSYD